MLNQIPALAAILLAVAGGATSCPSQTDGTAGAGTGPGISTRTETTHRVPPAPVGVAQRPAPTPALDTNGTGAVGSGAACNPGWVCGTCPPGTAHAGTEWGYDPVLVRQLGLGTVDCNARP